MPPATGLSLAAVAACWCWKNWNTRKPAVPRFNAEVTGYGATSDGHDMVAPSGEGGERSMRLALGTLPEGRRVSYINAHGHLYTCGRRDRGRGHSPHLGRRQCAADIFDQIADWAFFGRDRRA